MDRETVITHLQIIHTWAEFARERDLQFFTAKHLEDIAQWADDALALLKEQEVPEELKLKIWNALYTKEDEYEKKLIEADKCHEWFSIYRPWLQMGFNIAIDAIAEWEGR